MDVWIICLFITPERIISAMVFYSFLQQNEGIFVPLRPIILDPLGDGIFQTFTSK